MSTALASRIAAELDKHFPMCDQERHMANGLALAEEAGEVVAALRRYLGIARRPGTKDDVASELADLYLTLFIAAHYLDIDIYDAVTTKAKLIFARGFKNHHTKGDASA